MGVLDLPGALFGWIDARLASWTPDAARLVFWSLLAAASTMALYWWLSPQAKIGESKRRLQQAKAALDRYEGDIAGARPLMREMLRQALRQIGLVLGPTLAAGLPVLCILVWASTSFGHRYPEPGEPVAVSTDPSGLQGQWSQDPARARPHVVVRDAQGQLVGEIEVAAPVTTVHKRSWWNALVGNPAGYLPEHAPLDRIEIGLPEKQYLHFGPGWMRGWEFLFLSAMMLAALAIKTVFRIH